MNDEALERTVDTNLFQSSKSQGYTRIISTEQAERKQKESWV
jgi:hypothetical protein